MGERDRRRSLRQRRPGHITGQAFEELPEFIATRTYVRCVDRLFQSLPTQIQLRLFEPMVRAAVSIGSGIACFHGEYVPSERVGPMEREGHRERALEGIRRSRQYLGDIARVPDADRAELLVARELLDRIEGSVRGAVLPGSVQA